MKNIAVIGAGTMGAGIAQVAACHACTVRLIDVNASVLERALATLRERLDRMVEKGRTTDAERDDVLSRIIPHELIEELGDVELAIEAVVERMDVKHEVFRALERATPADAILATNTSSLPVTRIAEVVSNPGRVIGMHFFNPAPLMPLVEIIATANSDRNSVDQAYDLIQRWGKTPVRAKDTPGFIVNRVARGFYLEALRLLGEGVAGVDEIDGIMKGHGRFRMGPFELMDLVGLDVNLAVSASVHEQMGSPARFAPHEIQQRLVREGKLGRKTGKGFYDYSGSHPLPACPVDRRSFTLPPQLGEALFAFCARAGAVESASTEQYILGRILAAIVNEAGLAFAEGVASPDDIDLAMEKGTNYPKGPLAWAEEIGHPTVGAALRELNSACGDGRYEPAPLFA